LGTLLTDLRYGLRMLNKHRGLAAISIVALALGLGLTTTMWSIVWGGILRGLPFERADQILFLSRSRPNHGIDRQWMPVSDYSAWREQQHSFEDLAAYSEGTVNVTGVEGRPERFEGAFVTAATFKLLRTQPVLGRLFGEEDNRPGAAPVVIIGSEIWQNKFGGDRAVIGKTIRTNGVTREIIGVMPRGFQFPTNAYLWLPRTVDPLAQPWGQGDQVAVIGRLKDGVTLAQATRDITLISDRLITEHPKENEGVVPLVKPFTEEYIGREPVLMLWTMMAAVFGVLLIACSNVANLLLARAATRTREVAVRTALGASRWRIVSQLLTESFVIAAVGSVIGIGIAWGGVHWFVAEMKQAEPPFWVDIKLDGAVLAFTAGITVVAALVSGIIPALQATGSHINEVLKDESRGASSLRLGRFSRALVVAELALAGGLLVAAGFMIQSVVQLSRFDYGVPTEGVFTARIALFEATYPDSAGRARFWNQLSERLEGLPGRRGSALMTALPGLNGWQQSFAVEGKTYASDRDYPTTRQVAVSPSWFETFGVKAVDGRLFGQGDIGGSLPVAIVSAGFVARHFADQSPIGRRIRMQVEDSNAPWLTIVGVVPEVWFDGNNTGTEALRTVVFTPLGQGDYRFLSMAVTSRGDPMAMAQPAQAAVSGIDPDQPIYFVRTLTQAINRSGWFYSVFGILFMAFGGAALFLATVGVYGVMSFAVSNRTREIGVRMALGASARDVTMMFLRQGGLQALIGLTLGLGFAWLLAKGLGLVLFQVDTRSPLMYAGVTSALAVTCIVANLIPARRAMLVDPVVALRYE
jgi:putative ABC transport system permease protein